MFRLERFAHSAVITRDSKNAVSVTLCSFLYLLYHLYGWRFHGSFKFQRVAVSMKLIEIINDKLMST